MKADLVGASKGLRRGSSSQGLRNQLEQWLAANRSRRCKIIGNLADGVLTAGVEGQLEIRMAAGSRQERSGLVSGLRLRERLSRALV